MIDKVLKLQTYKMFVGDPDLYVDRDAVIELVKEIEETIGKIKAELKAQYELAVKHLYWEKAAGHKTAIEIIDKNTEVENDN